MLLSNFGTSCILIDTTGVKILKLLEGDYNKVFLLTMDNGDQVIARLPNPNAGSNFYTIASEIATRRFIQLTCDIPMPRLCDWDLRDRNTVGSEWIIEEKATGQPLRKFWSTMDRQAQLDIVQQIVDLEAKLASVKFARHGSIYLKRWLQSRGLIFAAMHGEGVLVNATESGHRKEFLREYAIGPSTERKLYRGPGDLTKQFRGPCK